MHSHTFLITPLLLIFILFLPFFQSTFLEQTCESIAATRPDLNSNDCISSLLVDPSSPSSNPKGLALIASHLSIANATKITTRVRQLIDNTSNKDATTYDCLGVCLDVYSDATDHLRDAVVGIESGNYRDAVTFLSVAVDAPENCEDAFGDVGMSSLLVDEDREFEIIVKVALAIVATL